MLRQININNFAIIENMSIDFNNGLTIITGQTGAGKSIVIDAIEQLLGQRASTNLIGSHSEQAILEGIFDVNDEIIKILSKYDIFIEDDYLIINKKISKEGKSQTRLNNKIITSEIVKSIAPLLVEIISQNEAILLNNYHNQIMYLDSFFNEEELKILNNYQNDYHKYLNIKNECHSFLNNVIDENLLNYYEEQLKEINEYYLDDEELNTLQTKEKYYNEYENINDYTYKIINIFHNDNIIDCLYDISNYSAKLKEIDVSFSDFDNNINDIYYLLKNSYDTILNKKQSLNYDEDEFTNLKQRLFNYQIMAKKYSYSSKIINSTKEDLINKIAYIKNSDDIKNNYLNEINKLETALNNQALVISNIRHNYIELIENKIACELKDLYLNNASFKIKITTTNYNINGQDHIEFMFSANKGTTIKPLAQVASGGELSRLLLALKTIQINNQNTLFIFDEIDSGVSGEVADAIGKKMSSLAQKNDIIAITHLPQVAIYAKNHLYISKSITKDMTTSNYEYLSDDRIVNQIAKMISGDNISDSAIIHAQELLKNANK